MRGVPTYLLEPVPVDSTEWHLFILGDVSASISLLIFLILIFDCIPKDKCPLGQVVLIRNTHSMVKIQNNEANNV
jgi:hypothetical protein